MPHSSQNETNSNEVPKEGSKMLYGIEPISWAPNVGNQFFNFCVSVGVGGQDATNFLQISNDEQGMTIPSPEIQPIHPTGP